MPLASTYNPTFRPPSHWCAFSVYSFYIFKEDSRKTSFTFDSSDWILDLAHSRQVLYTCATTSALHIWIHINEHILPMVEKGFFMKSWVCYPPTSTSRAHRFAGVCHYTWQPCFFHFFFQSDTKLDDSNSDLSPAYWSFSELSVSGPEPQQGFRAIEATQDIF